LNSGGIVAVGGGSGTGVGSFQLPSCISNGNCSLNDIVNTGVNAVNFLLRIAVVLSLLVVVIAGFRYVAFAHAAKEVETAKKMLEYAFLGLLIMFSATAMVTFLQRTLLPNGATSTASSVGESSSRGENTAGRNALGIAGNAGSATTLNGGATTAGPAVPCATTMTGDFHLRPTATAASTGRVYTGNTPVILLERGSVTRGTTTIYKMRVVVDNQEGYAFPDAAELSSCVAQN
jgi:hypothetical protein